MKQLKQGTESNFNFEPLDNVLANPVKIEQNTKKAKMDMIDVMEESDSERSVSQDYSQQDSASSHRLTESKASGMRLNEMEDEEDFVERMSKIVKKQIASPSKNVKKEFN